MPKRYLYNLCGFSMGVHWNVTQAGTSSTPRATMSGAPVLTAGWSILMVSRDLGQHGQEDYNADGAELPVSQHVAEILLYGWYTAVAAMPPITLSLVAQAPPFSPSGQWMIQELTDWHDLAGGIRAGDPAVQLSLVGPSLCWSVS